MRRADQQDQDARDQNARLRLRSRAEEIMRQRGVLTLRHAIRLAEIELTTRWPDRKAGA